MELEGQARNLGVKFETWGSSSDLGGQVRNLGVKFATSGSSSELEGQVTENNSAVAALHSSNRSRCTILNLLYRSSVEAEVLENVQNRSKKKTLKNHLIPPSSNSGG